MTGQFILADMTSHRRNFGVQPIIDAAARRFSDPNKIIWLVPSYLSVAFQNCNGLPANNEIRNCDTIGLLLWDLIQREIESVVSVAPHTQIIVASWDDFIIDKARQYGRGVVSEKLYHWQTDGRIQTPRPLRPPIHHDSLRETVSLPPSIEDLQRLMIAHLRSAGATSETAWMYRSKLRPELIRANPHLNSASQHPRFASTFKSALDNAITANMIGESRPQAGKELIWLIEAPTAIMKPPVPSTIATQSQVAVIPTPPTYERSADFRNRLTALGIFCEKRERDVLMDALIELLKTGPQPISRLRRELPKRATELAQLRSVCSVTDFGRIVNFFIKLLLLSGALKNTAGDTILRNVGADASHVATLEEGAIDLIETYLLEQILKRSDVKDREHWQLALALFREFDQSVPLDDKLDRIAVLIAKLSDRIGLTDDGTYDYIPKTVVGIRDARTLVDGKVGGAAAR